MSLLLDALKKAADDKKKASQDDSVRKDNDSSNAEPGQAEGSDKSSQVVQAQNHAEPVDDLDAELNLELEEIKATTDTELSAEVIDSDEYNRDSDKAEAKSLVDNEASVSYVQDNDINNDVKSKTHSYEVSDEALSMLIHKTNREVNRSRRILVLSALMISLIILVAGGFYYYMNMQAEIASFERKHQIALQSMKSKTDKEKTPDKAEIIRNLGGDSDLDEKVRQTKKLLADNKDVQHKIVNKVTAKNSPVNSSKGVLSIERTNKSDPVGDKLDAAWEAYESARYEDAKSLYKEALKIEKRNRDAYLGLGAIAIIEKDSARAKYIYLSLLEQDPRDPIAIAAIASLHNDASNLASDEKYLLSLLQKNPDASHLNFALGNIYAQQSKWAAAQQSYFSAWRSDNDNADYIFNLAVSMDQLGKKEQAINFYKDSLLKANNKQVSFSRDAARIRINELSGL